MARITSRNSADVGSVVYDEGLRKFMSNVFLVMMFGLIVTGIVSEIVTNDTDLLSYFVSKSKDGKQHLSWIWWGLSFAEVSIVGWIGSRAKDPTITLQRGLAVFAVYSAFNGLTLAPVLHLFTQVSVLKVFFITACAFGVSALWGYTTRRNLTGLGSFFLVGLVGIIAAILVNMWLGSAELDLTICCLGVLLFAGLTAWDMQMLRTVYDEDGNTVGAVINGAVALYLDFINLFLFFLRFFGSDEED